MGCPLLGPGMQRNEFGGPPAQCSVTEGKMKVSLYTQGSSSLENHFGVLRRAQDERRETSIVDHFPFI
jgi:hypothetical protein